MSAPESSFPIGDDRQMVECLYCQMPQPVSRKAMTLTCKFCNKVLKLEELRIKDYQARRTIETCGAVTVEKKGNVVSEKVLCGSLVVRGRIKGNIVSRGPVLVGPEAEIRGDVTAPTMAVGEGAILEGHYRVGRKTNSDGKPSVTAHLELPDPR